ncbi:MAG TPA: secretin N-terminal domain-containing protein [Thermoanaerobaculia bacterium]|nr:secretin N-terminal domain-containing protein [Thermoanaerobaculia bacterium]
MRHAIARMLILLIALGPLAGCASHLSYRKAEIAMQKENWDEAVLHYLKAVEESPDNLSYRAALMRAKIKASQAHFEKAKEYQKAGVLERALVELQQAVQLDPTNQYAKAQLETTRQAWLAQKQGRDGIGTIEQMKKNAQATRPQPPVLNPRSNKPISLEFPEPVPIFQIYQALGKAFGINVLFDPNLKDQEISINLQEVTAQTALETLMRSANHFYKVIDEHTILIAADTPQNRRIYEDLVIQTFFLSNSEVKDMMTILRSLVDAKKIATNDQLNAIILRDTADKVKVAERIIEANDKSKAEVVIDVELLQINTGRLRELGVSLSQYSIGQQLDRGTSNPLRVSDLEFINQADWILTIPNFLYNFIKTNSDAQLLAKPQVRITEGEKANLVIGDRVPIPLTTFNTQNVGGNSGIVPITSFQYTDVGIKVELEPRVHHNQEITLKVKIEVSNISRFIEAAAGQSQPVIGTRSFDSVIRLKDGETNFLAGLIRTDERSGESGIPGLSEIPLLGRLFENKRNENERTDVILTLTPHIIRNAQITEEDLQPIWVGTEANITFRGGSPRVESDVEGPFDMDEGTPEEVQDAIRRRLQRLPRGLQPGEGEEPMEEEPVEEQQQPPAGIDLVPAQPPGSIFQEPEPPPDEVPPEEMEPPPPAGASLFSTPNASSTSVVASPRVMLASLRRERFAEDPGPLPAAVRLRLVPEAKQVEQGETFTVRIEADAVRPVSHLPIALAWDAKRLAVEKVEAGGFLGQPGTAQVLADSSHAGRLTVGASRLGDLPPVSGAGTVATVTFRALAAGRARIGFGATQALDAALNPVLPLRTEVATIRVRPDRSRSRSAPGPTEG